MMMTSACVTLLAPMPVAANQKRLIVIFIVTAAVLIAAGVAIFTFKSDDLNASRTTAAPPRPAADTPRGVMWDVWHAAMDGDRERVRAAMLADTDADKSAADAVAELLLAEAAFARQLQHTWPMSPTSRDGAGTWFGEGSDAGLLAVRENIDPAGVHATVNMHGTPVKLTRSGGAWKIDTAELVRARLKDLNGGNLAAAPEKLDAMTKAYRDLTREIAALRVASPSAAIESLRRQIPAATAPPAS
jgi:hypothetical protein